MNLLTAEEFVKQAATAPEEKSPAWLLPLIGGGAAAAGAGLLTGKKREGESARERAKRVIAAALSAGALGAGATYGATKAKDLWDESRSPSTGIDKEPVQKSIFSSLAARLGYGVTANRGMSWFGRNRLGNYMLEKNFRALPSDVTGLVTAKDTSNFKLKNLDKSKNLKLDTMVNRNRLRDLAGKGSGDLMRVLGLDPTNLTQARRIQAMRGDLAGAGVFVKGDRMGKLMHGLEVASGSPMMHSTGGFRPVKRIGGGLLGLAATGGAMLLPEAVNFAAGKSEDAVVDGAGNYVFDILPGAGKPSEAPAPDRGTGGQILDLLFKGR